MEDVVECLHLSSLPSGHVEMTQESTTGDSFVSDKLGYEVRVLCAPCFYIPNSASNR